MKKDYESDFEKFLSYTNEKQILFREILKETNQQRAHSLLDIGAGNGELSIPLSKHIVHYVAVERNPTFVKKLQTAEISVLKGTFPIELNEQFDFVLASHVVSHESHDQFIRNAWEALNPNGTFLIITYRGEVDDWILLLRELGEDQVEHNRLGLNSIVSLLNSLGSVSARKVITHVQTATVEEMIEALSFVFSDGEQQRKQLFFSYRDKLEEILVRKYKNKKGFAFPFQHFFLSTRQKEF